jgi:signal transduction histidine kinase
LGRDIDLAVYHMVQECLLNVAKHAGATRVSIVVSRAAADGAGEAGSCGPASAPEGMLEVVIEDNGPGSSDAGGHAGVGLVGMRERLQALGGRLEIGGGGERGFRVVAHIPLEPGREAMRA